MQIQTIRVLLTWHGPCRNSPEKQLEGAFMKNLKVWPHLTIVAVVIAVLAGVGVALWMRA